MYVFVRAAAMARFHSKIRIGTTTCGYMDGSLGGLGFSEEASGDSQA